MKIVHITDSIGPKSYGIGQVVINLFKAQKAQNMDVMIWCLDSKKEIDTIAKYYGISRECILCFNNLGPKQLCLSLNLIFYGLRRKNRVDIIHQHGIWTGISLASLLFSKINKSKVLIAPHGSLQKYVIKKSHLKKKIALFLYEKKNLANASCLYATSENEFLDFREYGLTNQIAVVNNGISDDWIQSTGNKELFYKKNTMLSDKRILLFMSRIAPKKGLPLLLEAWSEISKENTDWLLLIIGGDEDGHKKEIEHLINHFDIGESILIMDPVFGELKRDAFSISELFILPSHSEGFPMVVLDSMGAGVPAIVTYASPWEDLINFKCGWWVDISVDEIKIALSEATNKTKDQLKSMGVIAKNLVKSNYNWKKIAIKTNLLYEYLINNDKRPDFVKK